MKFVCKFVKNFIFLNPLRKKLLHLLLNRKYN